MGANVKDLWPFVFSAKGSRRKVMLKLNERWTQLAPLVRTEGKLQTVLHLFNAAEHALDQEMKPNQGAELELALDPSGSIRMLVSLRTFEVTLKPGTKSLEEMERLDEEAESVRN